MNSKKWLWLMLLSWSMFGFGCQGDSGGSASKAYDVKAEVTAVDKEKGTVTLDHEDIPGLMEAMEMEFNVESPAVLEGIGPGDQVEGRLEVRSGENVITRLEKQ